MKHSSFVHLTRNAHRGVVFSAIAAMAFVSFTGNAYADKQWYYNVTGYAGTQKVGPFSSQSDCQHAADQQSASGYKIAPCFSEGSDSSSSSTSTTPAPTSVPSTPAEAMVSGFQMGMAAAEAAREKQTADAKAAYAASAAAGTNFYNSERQRQDNFLKQDDDAERAAEANSKRANDAHVSQARNEALSQIKDDTGTDDTCEVQPRVSTPFFGDKLASPSEIAATMETKCPQHATRDVNTAWKQIHCAAEIAQHALDRVRKMETSVAQQRDLDDISYLAKESMNALNGDSKGMACSPAPPVNFPKPPNMSAITSQYSHMLSSTVADAKKIYDIQQQAQAAQQKIDAAKGQSAPASSNQTAGNNSTDDQIAKAYAEQKAWQQADQDKINKIYAQQQQMQQSNSDALASLRAAQLELNKLNSQKIQPEQDIENFETQNKAVLGGQLPGSN
jgi:hypothetical protein